MHVDDFRLITIVFFLIGCLIVSFILGLMTKHWMVRKNLVDSDIGLGALEGALLSLFGLFMAFAFSMASDRYNARRDTIIDEANAIGTATLRSSLYPDSVRNRLMDEFKIYLESRIEYFEASDDKQLLLKANAASSQAADSLWTTISHAAQYPQYIEPNRLMVPAMNEMFDAMTSRDAAFHASVPESILWVLLLLSICSSYIVGFGTRIENVNYVVGSIFVIMISVSLTLIVDIDRPRMGLITTKKAAEKVYELRSLFK